MRTAFSEEQLADPDFRASNQALRDCVHCGFCLATCPTYLLTSDERASPRGRIYLIKGLLETGDSPSRETLHSLDTCLSCLSCMTTCPSNVNYRHLIDHARQVIEFRVRRPLGERLMRALLSQVMPWPGRLRIAAAMGRLVRPVSFLLPHRLRHMVNLLKGTANSSQPSVPLTIEATRTMGLIPGCVQQVMAPEIDQAATRILSRLGVRVVIPEGAGCCGALDHHMGRLRPAGKHMDRHVRAWASTPVESVLATASGCGSMVKDFGFLLRESDVAQDAAALSAKTQDISEVLQDLGYQGKSPRPGLRVAYHGACSLEHGQGVRDAPRQLLAAAGFQVVEIPDGHLCCGSAGSHNVLHPHEADQMLANKTANIDQVTPDVIATGNIGCLMQLRSGTEVPVVHTIELLDWAAGGPRPAGLAP